MKAYIFTITLCVFQAFGLMRAQEKIQLLNETGELIKNEYIDNKDIIVDEIIIKFKEGTINNVFLEADKTEIKCSEAMGEKAKRTSSNSFFKYYKDYTIRKLVRKYKPSYGQSTSRNGKKVTSKGFYNMMVMKVDPQKDIQKLCEHINSMDEIIYAEPNYPIKLNDTPPNDTDYSLQEGFENPTDRDIDANRAWDFTTGNYGVKVGVIDNGIDYHNVDLGNGMFGVHGAKVRGGWDFINNDSNPDYDGITSSSHGTECAGIIAGLRNNNAGISGLAGGNGTGLGAQLFALKVGPIDCSDGTIDRCLNVDKIIEAIIEGSVDTPNFGYGCHILNNSYGSYNYRQSMLDAVSIAAQNNVVFVASKGNGGNSNLHYPSDYNSSWVVSVGGTNASDNRWSDSNTGNNIDVSAPATPDIVYTTTIGTNQFRAFSGTSASAPHVAGLSALILSEAIEQGVSLHHEDVESLIKISCDDVNGGGYDDQLGFGRINAGRALEIMNDPWVMNHRTVTGGTIVNSTDYYNTLFDNSAGGTLNGVYRVRRHEVQKRVFLGTAGEETFVWGRGSNASLGWSAAAPNHQVGYSDIVTHNHYLADLRTYIYDVFSPIGQFLGTFPTNAENVKFAYTVLYRPQCPYNVWYPTNTIAENRLFLAENMIFTKHFLEDGANVVYRAPDVLLDIDFECELGATFEVQLESCSESPTSSRIIAKKGNDHTLNKGDFKFKDLASKKINIFPNPVKDKFALNNANFEIKKVEVFNTKGQLVRQFKPSKNYDISELESGVYILKLQDQKHVNTIKIIKD